MRFGIGIVAAALVVFVAGGPARAEDAADPLNGLPPDRAWTVVVAALRAREAKLANISYTVQERVTRATPDGRKPLFETTAEFRHHPRGDWMHARTAWRGAEVPTFDRVSNWKDGEIRKVTRDARAEGGRPIGYVGTNPNTELTWHHFNQVLGLWVLRDGPPMSVVEWIEQTARTPGRAVTCTRAQFGGEAAVSVVVPASQMETKTFWFDPSRDWMMVGSAYFGGTPASNNWDSTHVTRAGQVDGVWLPLAASRRSGTTVSSGTGEYEYTVTAAKLGNVREADLAVEFPAGAIVSDVIHRTRYRVEADGSHTPAPRGRRPDTFGSSWMAAPEGRKTLAHDVSQ
jgi:hypothetical protein